MMPGISALVSKLKSQLRSRTFLRNVSLLAGGTAVAQLIYAFTTPILTRIYTPAQLGIAAVYTSILGVAVITSSLSYQIALPLPEDDSSAANLLVVCVGLVIATSGLVWLGMHFCGSVLLDWAHAGELKPYSLLIPAGLIPAGLYSALSYWAVRKRAYRSLAMTKLNQGAAGAGSQIALGLAGLGPIGLILGAIIGQSAGITTLVCPILREDRASLAAVRPRTMWLAANRYRRFPLLANAAGILNSLTLSLPSLLLSAFYGASAIGFFSLAYRLLAAPMALVGLAVGQVYLGEASRVAMEQPEKTYALFAWTAKRLAQLGVLILVVGPFAPWLFKHVFGAPWVQAGICFEAMVPMAFLQFVVSPVSRIAMVAERQDIQLALDAFRAGLVIFATWLAHAVGWHLTRAVVCYSASMTVSYIVHYLVYRHLTIRFSARAKRPAPVGE